jgi:hypothetical protein
MPRLRRSRVLRRPRLRRLRLPLLQLQPRPRRRQWQLRKQHQRLLRHRALKKSSYICTTLAVTLVALRPVDGLAQEATERRELPQRRRPLLHFWSGDLACEVSGPRTKLTVLWCAMILSSPAIGRNAQGRVASPRRPRLRWAALELLSARRSDPARLRYESL